MLFEWPKCQARGKNRGLGFDRKEKWPRKVTEKDCCIGLSGVCHFKTPSFLNTAAFCNKLWWKVQKSKSGLSIGRHEIILEKMWKWRFPCLKITIVIENHSGSSESLTQTRGGETFGGGGGLWRWQVTVCDIVTQCDSVALCDNSGVTTWSQSEEQQQQDG